MNKPRPISAEDNALVKRYLIVPMILDAFERDKQMILGGFFKSPTLYADLIGNSDPAADHPRNVQATRE